MVLSDEEDHHKMKRFNRIEPTATGACKCHVPQTPNLISVGVTAVVSSVVCVAIIFEEKEKSN